MTQQGSFIRILLKTAWKKFSGLLTAFTYFIFND